MCMCMCIYILGERTRQQSCRSGRCAPGARRFAPWAWRQAIRTRPHRSGRLAPSCRQYNWNGTALKVKIVHVTGNREKPPQPAQTGTKLHEVPGTLVKNRAPMQGSPINYRMTIRQTPNMLFTIFIFKIVGLGMTTTGWRTFISFVLSHAVILILILSVEYLGCCVQSSEFVFRTATLPIGIAAQR